ncbi:hypothetical protein AGABI1DRAFT_129363 [Agaricus bisporus var. burnettii JB137-S8]|uniref:F-box domain-containing protein n=1 Tax=Agaricus bisporus var. burnettii (strain JB137-S8 / ATCC MYA-4627 / FGSC 10392) TaxID=597362 RepID=K5XT99_AGABU|nr:uncharacterized protein AGABI1DRAFT_129363 [Agaricus bisporus var. burnettii JB137-S8]EKM78240.1 hypothetical protein AGABI1DRAFT_129363 [Agaricus bisporus var. burnettii JB137-S8]
MSINDLGNLDIWTDILRYFRISLTLDSDLEIKEKRKCLLRIALLSPSLTAPALDLLWQNMTSLVPVTRVINVNSEYLLHPPEILQFSTNHGGFWILSEPMTSNKVRERAYEYLTRIRQLRVPIGSSMEMGVGSILGMTLGVNPLLPRLKSLNLDFTQWNGVGTWINAIGTLISPSLTSISYTAAAAAQFEGILALQSILSSQGLALSNIAYRGQLSETFLGTCVKFQDLEVLRLFHVPSNLPVQRVASGVSIVTVFETFQNLIDLAIDARLLSFSEVKTRAITLPPLLQKLSIAANSPDIGEFLSENIRSSSLQSLTIVMYEPPNIPWKVVCDKIANNFPQLHSLSFRRANSSSFQQMLLQDLSCLLSRPTMRSLKLRGISHCFTEANICGFLNSWPDLQNLSITDDYTIYFSASLLIHLSRAKHLRTIQLPLDLTFLQDELQDDATSPVHSPITELTITNLASSPPSLEGKIKVAKNLLTLFPSLERVLTHSTSSAHTTYLTELEELLRSFRSAIVAYLQRKETERRLRTKKETEQ